MILYHNADINDLEAICRDGLVSLDVSKNDKWEEGHRAANRTDVVYLFNPTTSQNSFVNFGAALIEVDVDDAEKSELDENNRGRGKYYEYTVKSVSVDNIVKILITKIFKEIILSQTTFSDNVLEKIEWCGMSAEILRDVIPNRTDRFGIGTSVYSAATAEELASLVKMGKIFLASSYCYFRGLSESGEIIDFYNVKYF
jgi:hypothetical protein